MKFLCFIIILLVMCNFAYTQTTRSLTVNSGYTVFAPLTPSLNWTQKHYFSNSVTMFGPQTNKNGLYIDGTNSTEIELYGTNGNFVRITVPSIINSNLTITYPTNGLNGAVTGGVFIGYAIGGTNIQLVFLPPSATNQVLKIGTGFMPAWLGDDNSGGTGGSSTGLVTYITGTDTNIIVNGSQGGEFLAMMLTNAHVRFSNVTSFLFPSQITFWQDTNGNRSILSLSAVGGNVISNGVISIGTNANERTIFDLSRAGTNIVITAAPLTPTVLQTNFISGLSYTSDSVKAIEIRASVLLTPASVAGAAEMDLVITNAITGFNAVIPAKVVTISGSLVTPYSISINGYIPPNSTYWFTNVSTGAGNASAIIATSGLLKTESN